MAEGRERSEWNRTASLMVKIHNTHIVKARDAIKFEDVHPYFIATSIRKQQKEPSEGELLMLKRAIEGMNG